MLLAGLGQVVSNGVQHRPLISARSHPQPCRRDVTTHAWKRPWSNQSAGQQGLPLSLFHPFKGLPADAMKKPTDEELCDPSYSSCKTPVQVYEDKCNCCSGTGWARSSSRIRKHQRRRPLATCLSCTGLGYVRLTTASFYSSQASAFSSSPERQPMTMNRPEVAPKASQAEQLVRKAAEAAARAAAEAEAAAAAEEEMRREAQDDEWGTSSSQAQVQASVRRVLVAK